jgi:uncharacterized protein
VTAYPASPGLHCSRCGRRQPPDGPLTTADGTPISAAEYRALASLVAAALVCSDCVSAPNAAAASAEHGSPAAAGAQAPVERTPRPPGTQGPRPLSTPCHREVPLDERECWRLMRIARIGRLGFTENALPVILPAHFVVRDAEVVLATLPDGRVTSAAGSAIVAFEVDGYDPATREGWCVSTFGRSRLITDPREIKDLDELDFAPWSGNPDRRYIAVEPSHLRGKALTTAAPAG